jgi:hypothetical protein
MSGGSGMIAMMFQRGQGGGRGRNHGVSHPNIFQILECKIKIKFKLVCVS